MRKMKILTLLLCASLAFSYVGCSNSSGGSDSGTSTPSGNNGNGTSGGGSGSGGSGTGSGTGTSGGSGTGIGTGGTGGSGSGSETGGGQQGGGSGGSGTGSGTGTSGGSGTGTGTGGTGGSGSGSETVGGQQESGLPTGDFTQTGYHDLGSPGIINGTSYDIVTFGNYPQSLKADNVTVSSTATDVNGFVCYKGSDNEWYVKHGESGNEKYFKVEPIKWRVLTESYDHDNNPSTPGKKLLLAEKILINCMYYDYCDVNRTIGTATIYPNNYEHSRIRAFLNGLSYQKKTSDSAQETDESLANKGFFQTAFTTGEQDAIAETIVDNTKESLKDADGNLSTDETYVCSNTKDKIFLLSEQEATKTEYGFAAYNQGSIGNTRIRMTTDFAKANGASQSTTTGYGGYWWLRSPCYDSSIDARGVYNGGTANNYFYVDNVDLNGIVPALCLN